MLGRKELLSVWNESIARVSQRKAWSTGLLVLSSAALGGIAVALWNRQSLSKMRDSAAEESQNMNSKSEEHPDRFFDNG
jgi:hypothetical protein